MWCKKEARSVYLASSNLKKKFDLATSTYIVPQLEVVSFMMVPSRRVVYLVHPLSNIIYRDKR